MELATPFKVTVKTILFLCPVWDVFSWFSGLLEKFEGAHPKENHQNGVSQR
jgi:hypothetical protein